MLANKTLQRYEFKYFLPNEISKEIQNHVSRFMKIDNFASKNKHENYFVRSIYFEDAFNTNFEEKINGYRVRKKFRLRLYDKDLNNSSIFLETKGRNLERTYKRRIELNSCDIKIIRENKDLYNLLKKYPNNHSIKEFIFETIKKNLKPKILIDYYRKPYINNYGLYFRLTFDQNLSCIKLDKSFDKVQMNQSISCKTGYTILEVKFERSIPLWFHRIIQSYNLRRESISKFVLGMCYSKQGEETSD